MPQKMCDLMLRWSIAMFNSPLGVTSFSLTLWVLLLSTLGADDSLCKPHDEPIKHAEPLILQVCFAESLVFFSNAVQILWKRVRRKSDDSMQSLHMLESVSTSILIIAGFTSTIEYIGWGNTCSINDGFNMPATLWIEWLTCVPLMGFIAVFVDDIRNFTRSDILFVSSYSLSIVFGFASACRISENAKVVMLSLSFLSFMIGLITIINGKRSNYIKIEVDDDTAKDRRQRCLRENIREKKLAGLLMFVSPLFPIIYMLGYTGVISSDWAHLGFMASNMLSKCVYIAAVCDIQNAFVASQLNLLRNDEEATTAKLLEAEMQASKSRRQFLRFVLHEVRIPLNSITIGITVLRENKDAAVEADTLSMMDESASFMANTLNDVLSLQKIEEGKMELSMQFFSVRAMVAGLEATVRGSLGSKRLVIEFDEGVVPNVVKGDRFRLEHVLANLLSNAVKFSNAGGQISLRVSCRISAIDGTRGGSTADGLSIGHFEFAVSDEGAGMSESEVKGLFTAFHQIRPNELQQGQGSGLGLAISRDILRLHGGELTCQSTKGQGTTFTATLDMEIGNYFDLDCGPNQTVHNSSHVFPAGDSTVVQMHQQLEFLIVDDSETNCKLLGFLLTKRSIRFCVASNGTEALSMVKVNPNRFAAIFMDGTMPIMGGLEAASLLRAELQFGNLIVGLTGHALDDEVAAFVAAGADMVLTKPLRIHQLDALLAYTRDHGYRSLPNLKLVMNSPSSSTGSHITRAECTRDAAGSASMEAVAIRVAQQASNGAEGFSS